jgi:hypothetical protein
MDGLFDEVYDELLEEILNNPKVQEYMKKQRSSFQKTRQSKTISLFIEGELEWLRHGYSLGMV